MKTRDPRHVFVGMALRDGSLRWETHLSFLRLLQSKTPGYEFYYTPGGGCDVAHARNLMTHECLTRTDCGLQLHIDSDENFGAEHISRLLSWFEGRPDIQICAGLYPLKGVDLRWSYGLWSKNSPRHAGLWEVGELCGGFTMFRTELIDQLIAAHPESEYRIEDPAYRGEVGHEIWAMGPIEARDWEQNGKPYRRRMSEDFMFSMRIRDLGHPLYVDPKIQLGHIGPFDYLSLHQSKVAEHGQSHL